MKLSRDILRKLPLALRIEIEENAQRKSLTQSELAIAQRHILNEVRKYKRPGERTDLKGATSGQSCPEVRATDIVGQIFGESRKQVENRLAVVEAAEKEPQRFGHLVETMDDSSHGLTKAYYELRRARDEERVLNLKPIEGKFKTLVVDPPWYYPENVTLRGATDYATMKRDEVLALPVASWAEKDCHLYLWTTNAQIALACQCMAAWGFEHRTMLTWAKPHYGLGRWFRGQTEHVLFGIKGKRATRCTDISTLFEAPLGDHSEKPERFYEIVRAASYPPYGEAFQRTARPDFVNLYEQIAEAAE
jgi:N6-adenosine-specific RNA methylase IME4